MPFLATVRHSLSERTLLAFILGAFVLLGFTYALTTPPFEASDELWHYPMVRHLADGNTLPVQVFDPEQAGPWKQEASQPPLYYYLGAALTFWIDTSDMERVRWPNPHVDNGVITADGNNNLVIHDPAASPWQGTLLAVRIVRLASVLLGAVTVYLTYRIARLVAPSRPAVYLGAAAVNAFTPMFLFISGAVNNDNLALPLASLALFVMIQNTVARQWTPARWLLLGIVVGLAALTKEGTLGLLPLAWGTAFVARWQASSSPERWRSVPRWLLLATLDFALLLLPVLLIAGWWYVRNLRLYGDLLGWNAFIAVLGQRAQPATLTQLWDERWGFLASYWGLFGGVNVPMARWIYTVLNSILLLALPGFVIYLFQLLRVDMYSLRGPQPFLKRVQEVVSRHFPLIVNLLFTAAVVYGLVNWATTTWSSQGRLAFTAISSLTTLLLLGLTGWLPPRAARAFSAALAAFLFSVALAAPFLWIRPAYAVQPAATLGELEPANITFGERLRLIGYDVAAPAPLEPGDEIEITVAWEVVTPMDTDWSVFVHLNDPVLGTPIAQRDMYLGRGLVATSLMQPGERIIDTYHLQVPGTALAPAQLELVVGLYDYQSPTGERLRTATGLEAARLTTLTLAARAGKTPNPVYYNFGDELALTGFRIDNRIIREEETLQIDLYWEALAPLATDYTFTAQVLDVDTTRWAASDVSVGREGLATSQWRVGETHIVQMRLPVQEGAQPGVYPLFVGAYTQTGPSSWQRLQLVEGGRITMTDLLALTQVRIE